MAKCGGCGKFLSPTEAIKCDKCRCSYHKLCLGMKLTGPTITPWCCPECNKGLVRDNQAETPVRGHAQAVLANVSNTSHMSNTTSDTTQELSLDIFRAELRIFKEEVLNTFRSEFSLLREDLAGLRSSLKATNERLNNLEERVAAMENLKPQASSDMDDIIAKLRSDLNDRDQELLGNDLQISNLPETSGESPIHTVMLVASKMGVKVEARDIVYAERVGGRRINATQATAPIEARPRFLVVRLARRDLRDQLLTNARTRRGMTSADLDIAGPATRFYVNERLTKLNRELFRAAREVGGRLGWQFIWSKRGRIFARNKPGDSACIICCEADIQRIFGSASNKQDNGKS